MVRVFLDLETYNEEPLANGTHKYAETAKILLLAYAIDDGEAKVWDRTAVKPMPEELKLVLRRDDVILIAHNSSFDRTVLKRFSKRFEDANNWEDTMVRALAHSLPGALGTLCALYQVEEDKAKDRDGKKLIQYFCKPRPEGNKLTRFTHPNEWERFKEYCRLDVEAMRDIYKRMPTVNNTEKELALWRLDQKINDRGFAVDVELVGAAIKAVTEEQARTRKRTKALTEGELESTTKRDEFLRHLLWVHGVDLPDAQAATIERRIEDPQLPEGVKELLRLRLLATTYSTAKYKKLRAAVSSDGRLRGSLQFCGAGRTARWSGRMFQPQNLPRPTLHSDEIELGIDALKADCADMVFGDQVMELASSALRGCIIAPPGKKLVVADLSNIEGRDQAWIAGEKWKLKAFREYDTGTGHDLYALAYAKMFKVTPESVIEDKKKGGSQRQIGKTSELSGGYGGGVGSFVTFATAFGLDLDALAEQAEPFIDTRIRAEAEGMWEWAVKKKRTLDLEKRTFIVMDSFKRQWREAHPNISSYWTEIEDKARMAIANPKHEYNARGILVERRGPWLYLQLPSGRSLCYPNASVAEDGSISFMGINHYTRKWSRIKTYGGKLFENCLTGDTAVYTLSGEKKITQITEKDFLWDGEAWVSSKGCVFRGKRKVVKWLGIRITQDHKILAGSLFAPVIGLGVFATLAALRKGRASAPYELCLRKAEIKETPFVNAPAEMKNESTTGVFLGGRPCVAPRAMAVVSASAFRNIGTFLRTRLSGICGRTASQAWSAVATTKNIERIRTTARAVSKYTSRGFKTAVFSLYTRRPCLVGMTYPSTWTEYETMRATDLTTYGSCLERLTAKIAVGTPISHTRGLSIVKACSERCFSRAGRAIILWSTILRMAALRSGLYKNTTAEENTYDILDCGPRQRFAVRTALGPVIVHNCCQAVARDVMAENMPAIEDAGYEIVLSVHDELICEAPDRSEFNPEHLSSLLAKNPPWAPDMPLAAAGFEAYRYKKE